MSPAFDMTVPINKKAAVLPFLFHLFFSLTASAATCYNANGSEELKFNYVPCNLTTQSGPCCSSADECMSNGMCFNTGANNLVSQAGCTDPHYNATGCSKFCNSNVVIYPCPDREGPDGSQTYCCGSNCCKSTASTFKLPIGTVISRSSQTSSFTKTSISLSSSTLSQSTSGAKSSTSPSPALPSVSQPQKSDSHSLAIGLGVGIPLGLVLIGAVLLVFRELRRHNHLLVGKTEPAPGQTGNEKREPAPGHTSSRNPVGQADTTMAQSDFVRTEHIAENAPEPLHELPQSGM